MFLSDDMYVPSLRWRQAEYQALMHLSDSVKSKIVPLITLPDVEFDFEIRQPKKSVHDHVLPFPKRFCDKWAKRPAWITLNEKIAIGRMNDNAHVFDYIFDTLRPCQAFGIPAIPLMADTSTLLATKRAIGHDQRGVGIIVRLEDIMSQNFVGKITQMLSTVNSVLEASDLIIDLRAPNFEPYMAFARALVTAMVQINNLSKFRNLVLMSTAIPQSFAVLSKGTDEVPRHDWIFYRELLKTLPSGMRCPTYGDYTIVHPEFTIGDMRTTKPAGKIIYTTPDSWMTRKGGEFRGNAVQMHKHCDRIVNEPVFQFQGARFSYGDDYIAKCAVRQERPSNLTRWKNVAINHHITLVATDLAKLTSASSLS